MTSHFSRVPLPIEDRIEQLATLALAIILIATLVSVCVPRGESKKLQEGGVRKGEPSRLVAKPRPGELQDRLVSRPERRAKAI
jgi:hypothetical protein